MKKTAICVLVVLNVVLAGLFLNRYIQPNTAQAQARRPGDYMMMPVLPMPGQQGVVCVVDTTNGQMSAIALDENSKKLVAMPSMNLNEMLSGAGGGRRGR